jgi:hypothetical protein
MSTKLPAVGTNEHHIGEGLPLEQDAHFGSKMSLEVSDWWGSRRLITFLDLETVGYKTMSNLINLLQIINFQLFNYISFYFFWQIYWHFCFQLLFFSYLIFIFIIIFGIFIET